MIPALDASHLVALAAALGWASGFRLYAVLFITGMAGFMGWIPLPAGLQFLAHPAVLAASGFMLMVEFLVDKVPYVDSLWDALHTLVRIPAGAALAGAVFGAEGNTAITVAALLGGTLAATTHATKMTTRAAINTSPEPFSNIALSLFEDGLVVAATWLAMAYPVAFGLALCVAIALMFVTLALMFKYLRIVVRNVRAFLTGHALPEGT